jgi:hypothetical protein
MKISDEMSLEFKPLAQILRHCVCGKETECVCVWAWEKREVESVCVCVCVIVFERKKDCQTDIMFVCVCLMGMYISV